MMRLVGLVVLLVGALGTPVQFVQLADEPGSLDMEGVMAEPVVEVAPAPEPASEPIAEAQGEPAPEAAMEFVAEPAAEPAAEPVAEPAADPAVEVAPSLLSEEEMNMENPPTVLASSAAEVPTPASPMCIALVTAPQHFRAREAIRQSWGSAANQAEYQYDVKFFIGELPDDKLDLEERINNEEGVVRLSGFKESYHTLSYKALGIFTWAADNGYSSVLKMDDDSLLRPELLRQHLQNIGPLDDVWTGRFNHEQLVMKEPEGKWYMYDQYPHDTFPPFPQGLGFIVGKHGLDYLSAHRNELTMYRVDDAAIGIWLQGVGLREVDLNGAQYPYTLDPNSVIINPVDFEEMVEMSNHFDPNHKLNVCTQTTLCPDSPNFSISDRFEFATAAYTDHIPRA